MSFFSSRKKHVGFLHLLRCPIRLLTFLFLPLFSSFKTGEAPDSGPAMVRTSLSRHRHVSPLLYLRRLRLPNCPPPVYCLTILQPNHPEPEPTWYFRSKTGFSSPPCKLFPLELAPCHRSRPTVFPTAPITTPTSHLIAITPPSATSTTATTCLPMVGTSTESLTSHTYQ